MTYMSSRGKYLKIQRFKEKNKTKQNVEARKKPPSSRCLPQHCILIHHRFHHWGGLLPLQPYPKAFVFLFSLKPCVLPQSQLGARTYESPLRFLAAFPLSYLPSSYSEVFRQEIWCWISKYSF